MTSKWLGWRLPLSITAGLFAALIAGLTAYGLSIPAVWYTGVYAGGWVGAGTHRSIELVPFGPFTQADVFTIETQSAGQHLYVLGSDPAGRDLLALVAHAAMPSLELVAVVVLARVLIGIAAGVAMGFGLRLIGSIADTIGSWIIGFPYLALAVVVIESLESRGKVVAFVAGMALVGWRDVALQVAERIEHVRSQSFAEAAASLGTRGLWFLRLHVLPFLRPMLTVEIPFQASAALVLLAELGFLQLFVGPVVFISYGLSDNTLPFQVSPELGQMLANTRQYLVYNEMAPVLVPAFAVAALAFAFELIGTAMRGRWRFAR